MARRMSTVVGVCGALVIATVAMAPLVLSSFSGAPAGVPVPFSRVVLPQVASSFSRDGGARFAPGPGELLTQEQVITSDAQMRYVWSLLFAEPYDPSRFDFSTDFVVFVGGGRVQNAGFDITSVEQVLADYNEPMLGVPVTDPFLAVTATTSLPGILPYPPPPPTWVVAAARVPRVFLDDVVFHRAVIAFP